MLTSLNDDVLAKIFQYLLIDPLSYRNLSLTCKRFHYLANHPLERTPYSFDLQTKLKYFSRITCESHGRCSDLVSRFQLDCEQQLANKQGPLCDGNIRDLNASRCCHYHRLSCMMRAKTAYSRLRFRDEILEDTGCLAAFRDSFEFNKVRCLLELELKCCSVAIRWLDTILEHLTHLDYLILSDTYFDDDVSVRTIRDRKTLKILKIKSSGCQVSDKSFKYLLDNCPAIELNLTHTPILCESLVLNRYYRDRSEMEIWSRPSGCILSFPMIHLYMRKHHKVMRSLIVSGAHIYPANLRKIVHDRELKDVQISLDGDGFATKVIARAELSEEDLKRISF